jgi:hypothetical protein
VHSARRSRRGPGVPEEAEGSVAAVKNPPAPVPSLTQSQPHAAGAWRRAPRSSGPGAGLGPGGVAKAQRGRG